MAHFFFNSETGAPDHGATCQGYRDGSAWARGRLGVFMAQHLLINIHIRRSIFLYLRMSESIFLIHLPKDLVPYWDLEFTDGADDQPRDSSVLLSLRVDVRDGKISDGRGQCHYRRLAGQIMKSVYDNYAVKDKRNPMVLCFTVPILTILRIIPAIIMEWMNVIHGEIISIWKR